MGLILHPELQGRVWHNAGEIPANGIDDDRNGYTDDVHGWNFLGNVGGKDICNAGVEQFREYKRLRPRYKFRHLPPETSATGGIRLLQADGRESGADSYLLYEKELERLARAFVRCDSLMVRRYGDRELSAADFFLHGNKGYGWIGAGHSSCGIRSDDAGPGCFLDPGCHAG